jgi:hypothetical protein
LEFSVFPADDTDLIHEFHGSGFLHGPVKVFPRSVAAIRELRALNRCNPPRLRKGQARETNFRTMLKFWKQLGMKSPYQDFTPYLNKNHRKTSGPKKIVVLAAWIIVAAAFVTAFILLLK